MAPYLVPVDKQLDDQTKRQQARNEILITELLRKRAEIEDVVASLESVIKDMEGANKILYAASKDMGDVEVD